MEEKIVKHYCNHVNLNNHEKTIPLENKTDLDMSTIFRLHSSTMRPIFHLVFKLHFLIISWCHILSVSISYPNLGNNFKKESPPFWYILFTSWSPIFILHTKKKKEEETDRAFLKMVLLEVNSSGRFESNHVIWRTASWHDWLWPSHWSTIEIKEATHTHSLCIPGMMMTQSNIITELDANCDYETHIFTCTTEAISVFFLQQKKKRF